MANLIYEGAEAKVFLDNETIIKQRIEKRYRNKQLNTLILKQRTKSEARILRKVKEAGVACPEVIKEDLENYTLYLSKIDGKPLREHSEDKNALLLVGKEIAKLHQAGIIHGDLTAQNIFFNKTPVCSTNCVRSSNNLPKANCFDDNGPIFLDFGLSFNSNKLEDFATDLAVLKGTILADFSEKTWEYIFTGYLENTKEKIAEKLDEIEKRKRYL